MKAAVSWSGGKDSCAAYYRAMSQGIEVTHLVQFINGPDPSHITHGVSPDLVALQAEAMGLPLIQKVVQWETYNAGFAEVFSELKPTGVEKVIFGDIADLRMAWLRPMCAGADVEPIFPLFGGDRGELIHDWLNSGYEAIITGVKRDVISTRWLGHKVDRRFINRLRQLGNVDLCGENGEYHTFVVDGPAFRKRVHFPQKAKHYKDGCQAFLDVSEYELVPKK